MLGHFSGFSLKIFILCYFTYQFMAYLEITDMYICHYPVGGIQGSWAPICCSIPPYILLCCTYVLWQRTLVYPDLLAVVCLTLLQSSQLNKLNAYKIIHKVDCSLGHTVPKEKKTPWVKWLAIFIFDKSQIQNFDTGLSQFLRSFWQLQDIFLTTSRQRPINFFGCCK